MPDDGSMEWSDGLSGWDMRAATTKTDKINKQTNKRKISRENIMYGYGMTLCSHIRE